MMISYYYFIASSLKQLNGLLLIIFFSDNSPGNALHTEFGGFHNKIARKRPNKGQKKQIKIE